MMEHRRARATPDLDGDQLVDLDDYAAFVPCFRGPGRVPAPPSPLTRDLCLDTFDADRDGDIDVLDGALLQSLFGVR